MRPILQRATNMKHGNGNEFCIFNRIGSIYENLFFEIIELTKKRKK